MTRPEQSAQKWEGRTGRRLGHDRRGVPVLERGNLLSCRSPGHGRRHEDYARRYADRQGQGEAGDMVRVLNTALAASIKQAHATPSGETRRTLHRAGVLNPNNVKQEICAGYYVVTSAGIFSARFRALNPSGSGICPSAPRPGPADHPLGRREIFVCRLSASGELSGRFEEADRMPVLHLLLPENFGGRDDSTVIRVVPIASRLYHRPVDRYAPVKPFRPRKAYDVRRSGSQSRPPHLCRPVRPPTPTSAPSLTLLSMSEFIPRSVMMRSTTSERCRLSGDRSCPRLSYRKQGPSSGPSGCHAR